MYEVILRGILPGADTQPADAVALLGNAVAAGVLAVARDVLEESPLKDAEEPAGAALLWIVDDATGKDADAAARWLRANFGRGGTGRALVRRNLRDEQRHGADLLERSVELAAMALRDAIYDLADARRTGQRATRFVTLNAGWQHHQRGMSPTALPQDPATVVDRRAPGTIGFLGGEITLAARSRCLIELAVVARGTGRPPDGWTAEEAALPEVVAWRQKMPRQRHKVVHVCGLAMGIFNMAAGLVDDHSAPDAATDEERLQPLISTGLVTLDPTFDANRRSQEAIRTREQVKLLLLAGLALAHHRHAHDQEDPS